jgi:hypothetical protein
VWTENVRTDRHYLDALRITTAKSGRQTVWRGGRLRAAREALQGVAPWRPRPCSPDEDDVDAVYFLKKRTSFIRFYYDESAKSFRDIQQKIELGHPPFDDPPYSEDSEPAFLEQWFDADTGIAVLGHSCVSILSETLKLYFQNLRSRVIRFRFTKELETVAKNQGFVAAYKAALGHILETDWTDCTASFDVIEQVVLARNRSQHGGDLTSFHVTHEGTTLRKHPRPLFASEEESQTWAAYGGEENSIFGPAIKVTRENLFAAIQETEKLADWIDGRLEKAWKWREAAASK